VRERDAYYLIEIRAINEEYPHSKLKYQSPNYFYRTYCEKQDAYFYQPALTIKGLTKWVQYIRG